MGWGGDGGPTLRRAAGGLTIAEYTLITHLFELKLGSKSHLPHHSDYKLWVGGIITHRLLGG